MVPFDSCQVGVPFLLAHVVLAVGQGRPAPFGRVCARVQAAGGRLPCLASGDFHCTQRPVVLHFGMGWGSELSCMRLGGIRVQAVGGG